MLLRVSQEVASNPYHQKLYKTIISFWPVFSKIDTIISPAGKPGRELSFPPVFKISVA